MILYAHLREKSMLKRKIEKVLEDFKTSAPNSALLLTGARQVGKTFIVRECAKRLYRSFLEINFIRQPEAKSLFANLNGEDDFFLRLSAFTAMELVPKDILHPGRSARLIFLSSRMVA